MNMKVMEKTVGLTSPVTAVAAVCQTNVQHPIVATAPVWWVGEMVEKGWGHKIVPFVDYHIVGVCTNPICTMNLLVSMIGLV